MQRRPRGPATAPTIAHVKAGTSVSRAARELKRADRRLLRHDHVLTRKQLIDAMIREPEEAERRLLSAVGRVVTDEEPTRLTALGEAHQGWERYIAAGINVFDEQENVPFIEHGQFLAKPDNLA